MIEHDAGLYAHPALLGVDLKYLVEIFRAVHQDGFAHRLPGQAGASATDERRCFVLIRQFDDRLHVVGAIGNHDADGLDFVNAGVGGVQRACDLIEAHLALDALAQFVDQVCHHDSMNSLIIWHWRHTECMYS